jgi:hypothetical protein
MAQQMGLISTPLSYKEIHPEKNMGKKKDE